MSKFITKTISHVIRWHNVIHDTVQIHYKHDVRLIIDKIIYPFL